jgi:hypothetical protein
MGIASPAGLGEDPLARAVMRAAIICRVRGLLRAPPGSALTLNLQVAPILDQINAQIGGLARAVVDEPQVASHCLGWRGDRTVAPGAATLFPVP